MLAGAFEALDEQEREIVFLRFIEDLDRKEVARRLGISESQLGGAAAQRSASFGPSSRRTVWRAAANAESTPAATPHAAPERGRKAGGHSGRLLLRMPRALHDDLAEAAEREGLSLNRFITGTLTAAIQERRRAARADPTSRQTSELEAREVPRWLPAAIVVNIVVVVVAAVVALVLLVIAWQNGW